MEERDMVTIVRRDTVATQGADLLRTRMLNGQLRPGDAVTEEAMAREIGISRPTMREVFNTLVVEGLLTRHHNTRVLHVSAVSTRDIREAYIVRRLLETAGVDAAASSPTPEDLLITLRAATDDLLAAVEAGDRPAVTRADVACHLATVAMVGSPDLVDFYGRMLTKLQIVMAAAMSSTDELTMTATAHSDFLTLLGSGRFTDARNQLLTRLDEAEQELLALVSAPTS
jgi:DNA-binding GntR family transcriptional regulator